VDWDSPWIGNEEVELKKLKEKVEKECDYELMEIKPEFVFEIEENENEGSEKNENENEKNESENEKNESENEKN